MKLNKPRAKRLAYRAGAKWLGIMLFLYWMHLTAVLADYYHRVYLSP